MNAALSTTIYIASVAASVIAAIGVSAIVFRSAERNLTRSQARMTAFSVIGALAVWYGIVSVLGAAGFFAGDANDRFPAIGLGLFPPLIVGLAALWLSAPLRRALGAAETRSSLIAIQAYRVIGGGFLVLMGLGELPAIFALPAGLGDLLIGLTATSVASSVRAGHRRVGLTWNALGILDLVIAVGLGLAASPGGHVIATSPTTGAMTATPLSIVPTFLVPLSVWLHAASLRSLMARDSDASGRGDDIAA